jgi:MFS family permease
MVNLAQQVYDSSCGWIRPRCHHDKVVGITSHLFSITTPLLVFIKEDFGISLLEASWITSCWIIGGMLGSLVFGWVGDTYGRRTTFMVTIIWSSTSTCIASWVPNFYAFLFFHAMTSYDS